MGFFKEVFSSDTFEKLFNTAPKRLDPTGFQEFYLKREAGWDRVKVAGVSFRQSKISKIAGRKGDEGVAFACVASLRPEPANKKHPDSVAVYIDGDLVGYLPTEIRMIYRPAIDAAMRAGKLLVSDARIFAYPPEEARTPNAGVSLYLPSPAEIIDLI